MCAKSKIGLLVFFLLNMVLCAQTKAPVLIMKSEPVNRFAVGFGANLSSVNILRNYKENPYRIGVNVRANYEISQGLRITAEYIKTKKFGLEPTWYDIKNSVISVALNAKAHIKNQEVIIYTISGLCWQRWQGFYTGQQDFSSARFFYDPNTSVLNRNIGLDLGLGFERPFPGFFLYGDFRYRFANVDKNFGITDVAYNLGIKFPVFKEDLQKKKKKNRMHKKGKAGDKYHWF